MKLYIIDELYEYVKDDPIFQEVYRTISANYKATSIKNELSVFYDLRQIPEVKEYFNSITEKLKQERPDLYKIVYYTTTDFSFSTLENIYLNTFDQKEQLLILERILSYGLNDGIYYKYIDQFCYIYENYINKNKLPKYIHLAYFDSYVYNFYYRQKRQEISFTINSYSTFLNIYNQLKKDILEYIDSTDTIENTMMEIRATYLNLIENELSTEDMEQIANSIIMDIDSLPFDNRYYSAGVIWMYEELAEIYFNNKNYIKFFITLQELYIYVDNALADLNQFFDALRYYNKFNIYSVTASIYRLYILKEKFKVLRFRLNNLKTGDVSFLNSKYVSRSRFNYSLDRDTLGKFDTYIKRWLSLNETELNNLANNTAKIEDIRMALIDYNRSKG